MKDVTFSEASKLFGVCQCTLEKWIEAKVLHQIGAQKETKLITWQSVNEKLQDPLFMDAMRVLQNKKPEHEALLRCIATSDKFFQETYKKIQSMELQEPKTRKRIFGL